MTMEEFTQVATAEFSAVPMKWKTLLANVVVLVADEPSAEDLREAGVEGGTLLGYYHGIPTTERGVDYGIGGALPDTITLYRLPILEEALASGIDARIVIRETLWHEIAYHFGFEEGEVETREDEGTNQYQ